MKFKKQFFLVILFLINNSLSAESKQNTLETQIFWGVTSILEDDSQFLRLPLYCLDDNCRNIRKHLSIQNLEMAFHEIARQEQSCKVALKNGNDFDLKDMAPLVRKMTAIEKKKYMPKKMQSIIDNRFGKSRYWEMNCENILRSAKGLEDPALKSDSNNKIIARNKEIVEYFKPHLCRQYNSLNSCLVEMSQKASVYNKVKRFAMDIKADDGVKEINISTLNNTK